MILCGDIHARRTRPRNRKDDYWVAQDRKLNFICEQAAASPPWIIAGDLLDVAKPGEYLLRYLIDLFTSWEVKPIVIPGQHDLPYHSLKEINDSGLGVLAAAGVIDLLIDDWLNYEGFSIYGCPWGSQPPTSQAIQAYPRPRILVWHHLIVQDQELWPGQEVILPGRLFRTHPTFDIFVTGDNHQTFAVAQTINKDGYEAPGRFPTKWVINSGSMMRMTTAQIDHKPCIFKYEGGVVTQLFLPIEEDVLDLTEREEAIIKDERIQAFIDQIHLDREEISLSFEANLQDFFRQNPQPKSVEDLVWQAVG